MIVSINNKDIIVPQTWNKLPLQKQLRIYQILFTDAKGILEQTEVIPFKRTLITLCLLDLNQQFLADWEASCVQDDPKDGKTLFLAGLNELCACSDFLFEISEDQGIKIYQVHLGLTKCPFPLLALKTKKRKLKFYPAKTGLSNISLNELGLIFTLFENYMQHPNEEELHELLATIYRPPKPPTPQNKEAGYFGDIRQPLLKREHLIARRIPLMKQLPTPVKQLLLFWIASCRQQLIQNFPLVFSGKGDASDFGFGALIMSLAGELTKVDQVASTNAEEALVYLSFLEEQRLKKESKRKASV